MHLLTMTTVAESYQPTQIMESSWLLEKLIQAPMEYEQWLERYASGIIFRLAFGRRIVTGREEEVRRIYKVVRNVERIASPGAYLVDTFPVLMHLPSFLAPFKKELEGLHQEELSLFRKLRDEVPADADATECWEHVAVKKGEEVNLSPDHVAYVVGTLFEAGSGTTAAAMMSFLLAMVLHPEALQKLQEELDRVVGSNRLPEFEDLPNLPLVRATVKEVLRWRPVTAGGVPHQTTKDDVYNGIFIPAGTNVHANQWLVTPLSLPVAQLLSEIIGLFIAIRSCTQTPRSSSQSGGYPQNIRLTVSLYRPILTYKISQDSGSAVVSAPG